MQTNPQTRQRRRPLRLVIFLLAAAILAVLLLWTAGVFSGNSAFEDGEFLELSLSPSAQNDVYKDGILTLTSAGYTWFDRRGESSGFVSAPFSDPVLSCGEKNFLVYDRGGKDLYVADTDRVTASFSVDNPILFAALGDKRYLAVITEANYHKGDVLVYDTEGNEKFVYHCAEGYPYLCTLSDNGGILAAAIAELGEDGDPSTRVRIFSVSGGTTLGEVVISGEIVHSLKFDLSDRLTVITATGVFRYSDRGQEQNRYVLQQGNILRYAYCDDFLLLFTDAGDAGYRYSLLSVSYDGAELGHQSLNEEVISVSGGADCALLFRDSAEIVDRELAILRNIPDCENVFKITTIRRGMLCCLSPSGAAFYKMKED